MGEWATYGAQLRAWVGLQVDEQLSRRVPGLMDARLSPISEALLDLKRQVKVLDTEVFSQREEKSRLWTQLETEIQRLELKAGSARSGALGDLAERTRASLAALASEETEARRQLEMRLEQVEAMTKVLDETLHAVDSSYSISTTDALAQLNSKVEVLDATFQKMDAALPRGGGLKEEALVSSFQELTEMQSRAAHKVSSLEVRVEDLTKRLQALDETLHSSRQLYDENNHKIEAIDETLRSLGVLNRGGPVASARLDYMAEQLEALQEQLVRAQPAGTRGLNPRIEQLEVATKVMDETYQALSSEMLQMREDLQKLRQLQVPEEDRDPFGFDDRASQDTQTSTMEARLKFLEPRRALEDSPSGGRGSRVSLAERIDEQLAVQLNPRLEEHSRSVGLELENMRKTMLALVRTELAKAFRTEAAAISSMDEQLKRKMQASAA